MAKNEKGELITNETTILSKEKFDEFYLNPILNSLSFLEEKHKSILIADNTIFHYTSLESAIKILNSKRLMFNDIKKSNDFLENRIDLDGFSYVGENYLNINTIRKQLNNTFNLFKQICFTTNLTTILYGGHISLESISNNENFRELIMAPYHFHCIPVGGFNKNRLWEQYANKGKGVCLIFDKSKLSETTINKNEIYKQQIRYTIDFESIEGRERLESNNNDLQNEDEYILNNLNYKHFDYRDESEFKLITKCGSEDYIEITDSLSGIIFGPNSNKEELNGMYENLDLFLKLHIYNDKNQYILYAYGKPMV